MFFGDAGLGPGGLMLPAKVAIDDRNIAYFRTYAAPEFEIEYLVLVTSQFGERKVSVYGFGHEKGKHYPTEEELRQQIEERRRKELEKMEREKAEEGVGDDATSRKVGGHDAAAGKREDRDAAARQFRERDPAAREAGEPLRLPGADLQG